MFLCQPNIYFKTVKNQFVEYSRAFFEKNKFQLRFTYQPTGVKVSTLANSSRSSFYIGYGLQEVFDKFYWRKEIHEDLREASSRELVILQ